MYQECNQYLIKKLEIAGITRPVHLNQKTLENDNESHKAAVISESDEFTRNVEKVIYRDQLGKKHKRTKIFDRKVTFIVTIGEYKAETCEAIFEKFVTGLDEGIYINGNYVTMELMPANWFDEEDKIMKSNIAVIFKVSFSGGIYKDTDYLKVGIDVSAPEMERGNNE
ncbi:MAG: SON protein [Anaerovorax sp.]